MTHTTTTAAARLGVSAEYVQRLCASGRIKATRVRNEWVIEGKALAEFQRRRRPAGRPRKVKT